MIFSWKPLVIVLICGSILLSSFYYHSQYIKEKKRANEATSQTAIALTTIKDLERRQRDVSALDEKYTKALTDAKITIDKLQSDVSGGTRRLQLSATCQPMRKSTATASMDDAGSPGLTDSAQQDYFNLRKLIELSNKQIMGLQSYIRQQCIRSVDDHP